MLKRQQNQTIRQYSQAPTSLLPNFTNMKQQYHLLLILSCFSAPLWGQKAKLEGVLQKWHNISLSFQGPKSSETAATNPFSDYRLEVQFSHPATGSSYRIPGYFAADGRSAETGASAGRIWRVHFSPDQIGEWQYQVSFTQGKQVAINGGGASAGFMDGAKGKFTIRPSDKKLPDNRANGRLQYTGERYLQYAETKTYCLKAGADSPENLLHYTDFDGTLNAYGHLGKDRPQLMKTWAPHAQDYQAQECSPYTWQGGKGKNLLGALRYLAGKGMNAVSFLTFSADGDDGCVFPHLVKSDTALMRASLISKSWAQALHQDRFDCSKLDQWEKVFSYAETKGFFLHFKTFENESNSLMGRSTLSPERKLYYRELIARFGHHLALNWNLSEETTMDVALIRATAQYIQSIDPYQHHRVIHTFPPGHNPNNTYAFNYYYPQLVGSQSVLTGPSLQLNHGEIHKEIKRWVDTSAVLGHQWVAANDEQGPANGGVHTDASYPGNKGQLPDNAKSVRHRVLWGTLMAGGWGVEYYFGYQTGETDLTAQDWRSRDQKWAEAAHALHFFRTYLPYWKMSSADHLSSTADVYVFAQTGEIYALYLPNGGSTTLKLPAGNWQIQWYNPRQGGALSKAEPVKESISAPDTEDWAALITKSKS